MDTSGCEQSATKDVADGDEEGTEVARPSCVSDQSIPENPYGHEYVNELADAFPFQSFIAETEHRGITVPQLSRIFKFAERNCSRWHDTAPEEYSETAGMTLSTEFLNLYHLNAWLIMPATKTNNCGFVELLANERQTPRWFVSHWWGERIRDFVCCVEKHDKVRCTFDPPTRPFFESPWPGNRNNATGEFGIMFTAKKDFVISALARAIPGLRLECECEVTLWELTPIPGERPTFTANALAKVRIGPKSIVEGDNYAYGKLDRLVNIVRGTSYRLTQLCTEGMADKWFDGFATSEEMSKLNAAVSGEFAEFRGSVAGTIQNQKNDKEIAEEIEKMKKAKKYDPVQDEIDKQKKAGLYQQMLVWEPVEMRRRAGMLNFKIVLDSPYWVCAYANRQHSLAKEVTANPRETSFFKALALAKGVLLILDEAVDSFVGGKKVRKTGPATPFTRIWCAFEETTALGDDNEKRDVPLKLDIVTCCKSKPKLLTDEIESTDHGRHGFPLDVIAEGLRLQLHKAQASVESDRVHILNCIAGRPLDSEPLQEHENYDKANTQLRAIFASAVWPVALEDDQVGELGLPDKLRADRWRKVLKMNLAKCNGVSPEAVCTLIDAIPPQLQTLELNFSSCFRLNDDCVAALAKGIKSKRLRVLALDFTHCLQLSDKGIATLVQGLPPELNTIRLNLWRCCKIGDAGLVALATSLERRFGHGQLRDLTIICGGGEACWKIGDVGVMALTKALPPTLCKLRLHFNTCDHVGMRRNPEDCFTITGDSMAVLGARLPRLLGLETLELSFWGCKEIGNVALNELARGFTKSLRTLDLGFQECTKIGDAGVAALAQHFPVDLENLSLDFDGCKKIRGEGVAALQKGIPNRLVSLHLNIWLIGKCDSKRFDGGSRQLLVDFWHVRQAASEAEAAELAELRAKPSEQAVVKASAASPGSGTGDERGGVVRSLTLSTSSSCVALPALVGPGGPTSPGSQRTMGGTLERTRFRRSNSELDTRITAKPWVSMSSSRSGWKRSLSGSVSHLAHADSVLTMPRSKDPNAKTVWGFLDKIASKHPMLLPSESTPHVKAMP
mmetsp:Transcript_130491/g.278818  ORF Transcript_130491/g.278818 Transcript_130491/m.278818 type:complete len:1072 (+) Transcript_130491:111-3326(+)